jgi:hypothetical protein
MNSKAVDLLRAAQPYVATYDYVTVPGNRPTPADKLAERIAAFLAEVDAAEETETTA